MQRKYSNDPIPENWDPFSKVREFMDKNNLTSQGTKRGFDPHMNPSKRAAMLGEEFEKEKGIRSDSLIDCQIFLVKSWHRFQKKRRKRLWESNNL